jgi:GT2 family glycosyltransferase
MDTTVIIVSYKSDHLIEKNIEIFDKKTKIIIIDNSQNKNLKENIENNHENVSVILNSNKGFGQAANLGAKLAKTKYIFFCSPDNYVEKNAVHDLKKICKDLKDEFGF